MRVMEPNRRMLWFGLSLMAVGLVCQLIALVGRILKFFF